MVCKDLFFIFFAIQAAGLQTGTMRIRQGVSWPLKYSGANAILRIAMQPHRRYAERAAQRSLTRYNRSSIHTINAWVLTMFIVFSKLEARTPVVPRVVG
jgi:hypothetical protein